MEIMREVGLPPGVVNFVSGPGAAVGDTLVLHPKTRFVSFTGSKEVGIHINEAGREGPAGTDLAEDVWLRRWGARTRSSWTRGWTWRSPRQGVIAAAFGFQGQKCSACSRAIVHEKVYDRFVEMLAAKAEALTVGDATDPENYMGPVVNRRSMESILRSTSTRGSRRAAASSPAARRRGTADTSFVRP